MTERTILRPNELSTEPTRKQLLTLRGAIALAYIETTVRMVSSQHPDLSKAQQVMAGLQCAIDTLHWTTDWAKDFEFSIESIGNGIGVKMDPKIPLTETVN